MADDRAKQLHEMALVCVAELNGWMPIDKHETELKGWAETAGELKDFTGWRTQQNDWTPYLLIAEGQLLAKEAETRKEKANPADGGYLADAEELKSYFLYRQYEIYKQVRAATGIILAFEKNATTKEAFSKLKYTSFPETVRYDKKKIDGFFAKQQERIEGIASERLRQTYRNEAIVPLTDLTFVTKRVIEWLHDSGKDQQTFEKLLPLYADPIMYRYMHSTFVVGKDRKMDSPLTGKRVNSLEYFSGIDYAEYLDGVMSQFKNAAGEPLAGRVVANNRNFIPVYGDAAAYSAYFKAIYDKGEAIASGSPPTIQVGEELDAYLFYKQTEFCKAQGLPIKGEGQAILSLVQSSHYPRFNVGESWSFRLGPIRLNRAEIEKEYDATQQKTTAAIVVDRLKQKESPTIKDTRVELGTVFQHDPVRFIAQESRNPELFFQMMEDIYCAHEERCFGGGAINKIPEEFLAYARRHVGSFGFGPDPKVELVNPKYHSMTVNGRDWSAYREATKAKAPASDKEHKKPKRSAAHTSPASTDVDKAGTTSRVAGAVAAGVAGLIGYKVATSKSENKDEQPRRSLFKTVGKVLLGSVLAAATIVTVGHAVTGGKWQATAGTQGVRKWASYIKNYGFGGGHSGPV